MRACATIPRDDVVKLAVLCTLAVDDAALAVAFCDAVGEICVADSPRLACDEARVMELVLECMRAHPDAVAVQSAAFSACSNMLVRSDVNQVKIVQRGGIDAMYAMSARHVSHVVVAKGTCSLTSSVAANLKLNLAVLEAGGIDRVCASMAAHPDDADVQQNGCAALWNIAGSAEGKAAVLASPRAVGLVRAAKVKHARKWLVINEANHVFTALGRPWW